jgi:hypothetical protein
MNLPGEQFKPADSTDLTIFLQDICQPCKHQEYCSIRDRQLDLDEHLRAAGV